MNSIKIFKELVAIKLKDGRVVTTEMSMKQVAELLNKNDFVAIGDVGFGKFEVKYFDKFIPTEIECFIYSQPKEIANRLESILQERKQKNLNTNGTNHLWDIYENRYGKQSDILNNQQ